MAKLANQCDMRGSWNMGGGAKVAIDVKRIKQCQLATGGGLQPVGAFSSIYILKSDCRQLATFAASCKLEPWTVRTTVAHAGLRAIRRASRHG